MPSSSLLSSGGSLIDVRHSENNSDIRTEISKFTSNQAISRTSFGTTEKFSVFNETFSGFMNNAILIAVVFLFLLLGGLAISFIFLLRRKAKYTIKKFIKL
ncbi:conserved Plasmodium chabaudi protein, unknown function [Plasmodium chabaudi chabaudi]|uniref:Uncharacterized protein n=1 Tax=Plasmodium chabaudi chabaudi TaxID=31271 RepID=A0A4V0K3L4_PLACU|nr:conserved Plasmodium chabaudi protein, unknown function [Plasmodium chabaudi chabaudi]VTZ66929.1 conserved Plasmodium chabaudi protein, unknown function [Plasmodium chabaudi chabaudi]|eukprot:XP_735551.2 conserved Plasmodium chabaudi protein, unknown function [Plasmodium chabaudi chabaudi]